MGSIWKELCDYFYRQPENALEVSRVKVNHQLLRQRLSNLNRKLVLRVMDDKDLSYLGISLDNLMCGFRLARQITNKIQSCDGCSNCSQRAESDTRQLFYKGAL